MNLETRMGIEHEFKLGDPADRFFPAWECAAEGGGLGFLIFHDELLRACIAAPGVSCGEANAFHLRAIIRGKLRGGQPEGILHALIAAMQFDGTIEAARRRRRARTRAEAEERRLEDPLLAAPPNPATEYPVKSPFCDDDGRRPPCPPTPRWFDDEDRAA